MGQGCAGTRCNVDQQMEAKVCAMIVFVCGSFCEQIRPFILLVTRKVAGGL